jgi:hypothetical protein
MSRKKKAEAQAESSAHPWEAAGFVPVTVKFTPELHQRAKVWSAGYRGRLLSAFVTLAVQYVLDECDAGRQPARFVKMMKEAEAAARPKKLAAGAK